MSYLVLARKWRPRNFEEMVGQEHVLRALVNALDSGRVHHAFLFTGTRGVGKTTIARILAKSLNCEGGVSSKPCGACAACREIDEGRFVDLIEVDAASRTKVDDTRELLENVQYAPTRGRYKVYLIDEVHMLSTHSFNALLKTLEEPPPHVKFLLATTDPQKVPVTVLSRCLQFNLKRLLPDQILGQLGRILEQEGISFESAAIAHLAHAAEGSMRDGLSLLDQAIAYGGGRVIEGDVRAMLGLVSREIAVRLLSALASGDGAGLLDHVADLADLTPDFGHVLRELLRLLHRTALYLEVPSTLAEDAPDAAQIRAAVGRMSPEDVQLYYQIGLLGQQDLELAPDPRGGLEMVLLRMLAFRPETVAGGSTDRPGSAPERRDSPPAGRAEAPGGDRGATPDARAEAGARMPLSTPEHWHELVACLKIGGIASQLAHNCELVSWDGRNLHLKLDPSCNQLRVTSSEERFKRAIEEILGVPVRLQIEVDRPERETPAQRRVREAAERQRAAEEVLMGDPLVQAVREQFSAEWVPGSIKPSEI